MEETEYYEPLTENEKKALEMIKIFSEGLYTVNYSTDLHGAPEEII